jgi:hypothetical protein
MDILAGIWIGAGIAVLLKAVTAEGLNETGAWVHVLGAGALVIIGCVFLIAGAGV